MVMVKQAALGGTLTFLVLENAFVLHTGECAQRCSSVCVHMCVCQSVQPLGVKAVCLHG